VDRSNAFVARPVDAAIDGLHRPGHDPADPGTPGCNQRRRPTSVPRPPSTTISRRAACRCISSESEQARGPRGEVPRADRRESKP
jgi:hypothetical protein